MPRPERPVDPEAGPLQRFASELRELRRRAGSPPYRELSGRANYSAAVLAEAAGGLRLPTLPVTLAYVAACGGEQAEWAIRWRTVASALRRTPRREPAELPAAVDAFTGRETELDWLRVGLDPAVAAPPRIAVVHGIGGVGKSALAVLAAHQVADRFPDGQLFASLHGYADGPVPADPLDVLGRFLRALEDADRPTPATTEEAATRYRSLLARRRMLVVLDNARDSTQVRPLIPGGARCAVLITSRVPLNELDGARRLHLDVLPPEAATALLGRYAGDRLAAAPQAAARLARACGYLPLALRIAGGRLASRPALTAGALADRLDIAHHRLDELRLGDLAVRASLQLSYRALAPDLRRAWRLLSLVDGPDVGLGIAAAQLDLDTSAADTLLERLAAENLLDEPAPGRFRFHDLVRLFAREQAAREETAVDRQAALDRLMRHFVATAERTARLLGAGSPELGPTLAEFDAERTSILAAAHRAADMPADTAARVPQLAVALYRYFLVRPHWRDWARLDELALEVARRLGDLPTEARLLGNLGVVRRKQFRLDEAAAALADSVRLHERLGDHRGVARSLNALGMVHFDGHRYDEAVTYLRRSLDLQRGAGDRAGEAACLNNLALIFRRTGRTEEALSCCDQSLAIFSELGDRHREARASGNVGDVLVDAGRPDEAVAWYDRAFAVAGELGDRHGQAYLSVALGEAHRRAGRLDAALAACETGLALEREMGDRWGEGDALRRLGAVLHDIGRREQARACWEEALCRFQEVDAPDADDVLDRLRSLR